MNKKRVQPCTALQFSMIEGEGYRKVKQKENKEEKEEGEEKANRVSLFSFAAFLALLYLFARSGWHRKRLRSSTETGQKIIVKRR